MGAALAVQVGEQPMWLWPQRAAFLPDHRALLVADAHLGKAQAFRQRGVPVPAGTTARNLAVLDEVISACTPRTVVFLGDLLHARITVHAPLWEQVRRWRDSHSDLEMVLVRGNHDHHAGDPPAHWGIQAVSEPWRMGPWALCHHPQEVQGAYALSGHLHPGVRIGGRGDSLRLPCFHLGARLAVLPAFGEFTGLHLVKPQPGDRVFAVAQDTVRAVWGA